MNRTEHEYDLDGLWNALTELKIMLDWDGIYRPEHNDEILSTWADATHTALHIYGNAALAAVLRHVWGEHITDYVIGEVMVRDTPVVVTLYELFEELYGIIGMMNYLQIDAGPHSLDMDRIGNIHHALITFEGDIVAWHTRDWHGDNIVCIDYARRLYVIDGQHDANPLPIERHMIVAQAVHAIYREVSNDEEVAA